MRGNSERHTRKWVLSTYTHCIDDMTNHPAVDCVPGSTLIATGRVKGPA